MEIEWIVIISSDFLIFYIINQLQFLNPIRAMALKYYI